MFRKTARALALSSAFVATLLLGAALAPAVYTPAQALYSTPLGQLFINRAANASALARIAAYAVPVLRDDVGAIYVHGASACYGGGDLGASVNAPDGGCWQLVQNDKPLSVKIWGCKDDATGETGVGTDNTSCANRAIAYTAAYGRSLYFPGNKYRFTAPLASRQGIMIFGDGCIPGGANPGTTLYFDHTGKGLSYTGSGLSKLRDLCTLRNQAVPSKTANTAYTATANDYDIYSVGQDLEIDNVYTINPTKQLYITRARVISRGLRGTPLVYGIFIDDSQDTDIVDQYRNWIGYWTYDYVNQKAFTAAQFNNIGASQGANLDMIHLGRADNPFLSHIFGISAKYCMSFNPSTATPADGGPNKVHVTDLDCDNSGSGGTSSFFFNSAYTTAILSQITGQQSPNVILFGQGATNNTIQIDGIRATLLGNSAFVMPDNLGNSLFVSGLVIDGFAGDGGSESAVSIGVNNEFVLQDNNPIIFQKAAGTPSNFNPVSSNWWGGTKYMIPQGSVYAAWGGNYDGSGRMTITAAKNGPVADVLMSGGSVVIEGQSGSVFQVVTGTSDSNGIANTPSGKIGLYFQSGVGYRIANNTGATANVYWREQRMGPSQ